jgi:recombination protein RecA
MPSAVLIREQIAAKIPGAFGAYQRGKRETIPTGIPTLDSVIGGVPLRALSQICGSPSSGRTTVLMSLLASATSRQECCALVDATDCFDPSSAEAAGVELSRMLWIRCGGESKMAQKVRNVRPELKPMEQAFASADLLMHGGGFGLVVVDLANVRPHLVAKVPLSTWFRFSRAVEDKPMALVFLLSESTGGSYAGLVLRLLSSQPQWSGNLVRSHTFFLQHLRIEAAVVRTEDRKPPQAVKPQFTAACRWG